MNGTNPLPERVQQTFQPGPRGVVGLVDQLVGLCAEQALQLDWHAGQCRLRLLRLASAEPFTTRENT